MKVPLVLAAALYAATLPTFAEEPGQRWAFTDAQAFMDLCGAIPSARPAEGAEAQQAALVTLNMCSAYVLGIMETVQMAEQPYVFGGERVCIPADITPMKVLAEVATRKRWKPLLRTTPTPSILVMYALTSLSDCPK